MWYKPSSTQLPQIYRDFLMVFPPQNLLIFTGFSSWNPVYFWCPIEIKNFLTHFLIKEKWARKILVWKSKKVKNDEKTIKNLCKKSTRNSQKTHWNRPPVTFPQHRAPIPDSEWSYPAAHGRRSVCSFWWTRPGPHTENRENSGFYLSFLKLKCRS